MYGNKSNNYRNDENSNNNHNDPQGPWIDSI